MKFAKAVFLLAAIYGFIVVVPQFFIEKQYGQDHPPPINHPEFYYGFASVGLAWQVLFAILWTNPARYRPMMIPGMLEKLGYGVAVTILYAQGRTNTMMFGFGIVDLVWAGLFLSAFVKTRPLPQSEADAKVPMPQVRAAIP